MFKEISVSPETLYWQEALESALETLQIDGTQDPILMLRAAEDLLYSSQLEQEAQAPAFAPTRTSQDEVERLKARLDDAEKSTQRWREAFARATSSEESRIYMGQQGHIYESQ